MKFRIYKIFIPVAVIAQLLYLALFRSQIRSITISYHDTAPSISAHAAVNESSKITHAIDFADNLLETEPTILPCGYVTHLSFYGMGIGNQMFLYASILGLAKINNKNAFMDPTHRRELSKIFDLSHRPSENFSIYDLGIFKVRYSGVCCRYSRAMEKLPCKENSMIHGYLQSYKYFQSIDIQIRREFEFRQQIRNECNRRFATATKSVNECIKVGVHLRRGDFTNQLENNFGHMPATFEYFQKAVTFFEKTFEPLPCILFLILGNDLEWNRAAVDNLTHADSSKFIVLEPSDQGVDMCLLIKCGHVIMSTGTFGWWAAYLAGGYVTYQAEYARKRSKHFQEIGVKDYFLPSWVPL